MDNNCSQACKTCQYCFSEASGKKGRRHRCGAPGRWRGYTVGFGKYPPADRAPAWCNHYNKKSEVADHEKSLFQ